MRLDVVDGIVIHRSGPVAVYGDGVDEVCNDHIDTCPTLVGKLLQDLDMFIGQF